MVRHRRNRAARALGLLVSVGCGDGETVTTGGFTETLIDQEIRHAQELAVADLDGDGRDDIIAALSLTDAVHVYLHPGDLEQPWEVIPISGQATIVASSLDVADLDGDGDLDVAAVGLFARNGGSESPGEVAWYENPGEVRGIWRRHRVLRPRFEEDRWVGGLFGARVLRIGDIDGDGDPDLVVGALTRIVPDGDDIVGGLYWFSNAGPEAPGRFDGPGTIDRVQINDLRITDWDQDNRLDVVTTGGLLTGRVSWYRNTPSAAGPRLVRRDLLEQDAEYVGLAIANVDGDRLDELLLTEAQTSTTSIRHIELSRSILDGVTPETLAQDLLSGPGTNARLTVADFDGDDVLDIVASTADGTLHLYTQGPGDTWTTHIVRTGYLGLSYLGHADVDDDGREDILTSTFEFGFRDRLSWWRNAIEPTP